MLYPKRPIYRKSRGNANTAYNVFNMSFYHRDKLKRLLTTNYRSKFKTARNPELEFAVRKGLDELFQSKNLNHSQLLTFEKQLQSLSKDRHNTSFIPQRNNPEIIDPSAQYQNEIEVSKQLNKTTADLEPKNLRNSSLLPAINVSTNISDKDQWAQILDHDLKKYAEERRMVAFKEAEKKRKVKDQLVKQMQDRMILNQREKEKQKEYYRKLEEENKILDVKEKKVCQDKQEKVKIERMLRQNQLKDEQNRKKKAFVEELNREKLQLNVIQKEIEEESNENKKNRERRLLEARKIREENERNKQLQEKKKREESEEDIKLMERMNKLVEMQEKKRVEEIKQKEQRMQALAKYAEENIGKKDLEKKKTEEKRFLKDTLEREKKDQQEEQNRMKLRRQAEVNAKVMLDEQIKQKEAKKHEEKAKSKQLAASWKQESDKFVQEQSIKVQEYKKKNINWHNEVLKQIAEKKETSKKVSLMNERELLINKQLIDQAENDKDSSIEKIQTK